MSGAQVPAGAKVCLEDLCALRLGRGLLYGNGRVEQAYRSRSIVTGIPLVSSNEAMGSLGDKLLGDMKI